MRIASDALIAGSQLDPPARDHLLEKAAASINYYQQRNALARECHSRTTVRKLNAAGIRLETLPSCNEDTS